MGLPAACIGIFLYIGVFKALFLFVIIRAPGQARDPTFLRRYAWMLKRWHPRYWFWGVLLNTRNLLLNMAPILRLGPVSQFLFLIFMALPLHVAQARCWPWREPIANRMNFGVDIALLVTFVVGLALLTPVKMAPVRWLLQWLPVVCCLFGFVCIMLVCGNLIVVAWSRRQQRLGARVTTPDRDSEDSADNADSPTTSPSNSSPTRAAVVREDSSMSWNLSGNGTPRAYSNGTSNELTANGILEILTSLPTWLSGQSRQELCLEFFEELPKIDSQKLRWSLRLLSYHLLADEAHWPSGGMVELPMVTRVHTEELAKVSQI